MEGEMGRIHSVQSLGTLDGPGVRFVVFMQGCPLRCAYCHNPDTWDLNGGSVISAGRLFDDILKYQSYFGSGGGVTVSGGEPLLQADFVRELFELCRSNGIHTALDTSGCIMNGAVKKLLELTNLCLLDIKMTDNSGYRQYIGCGIEQPLGFLDELESMGVDTWIRHVVVEGINSDADSIRKLAEIVRGRKNISKIELLPFRELCAEKYERLGLEFRFGDIPETTDERIRELEGIIEEALQQAGER